MDGLPTYLYSSPHLFVKQHEQIEPNVSIMLHVYTKMQKRIYELAISFIRVGDFVRTS